MPAFILYTMGSEPKLAFIARNNVVLGRDPTCDVVIAGDTVSRQHATVSHDPKVGWTITCLSETNPIVVNGTLLKTSAIISEGDEILFGCECLVVFSTNEVKAREYLKQNSYFAKSECSKCGWLGMISTLRRTPVCPKCGGEVVAVHVYRKDEKQSSTDDADTRAVSLAEVRASLQRLKTAKRSRLERIDGFEGASRSKELSETEPIIISKESPDTFRLRGFSWGKGVTIEWNGSRYVIKSSMLYPTMRINGRKVKFAILNSGDLVEIGRNRFRFITE